MLARIRRYLIAGLLFWLPVWVTVLVISFFVRIMDRSVALLPAHLQPEQLFGFNIPGLGIILSIGILLLTGLVVSNFLGKKLLLLWDNIVARIPLVRSIHSAVKQVLDSVLAPGGKAFRKVLLIQYPREGLWSIAFQTGDGIEQCCTKTGKQLITAFVPTTPNPTSGFLIMVPASEAQELDISIDDALKLVISLGVVQPKP